MAVKEKDEEETKDEARESDEAKKQDESKKKDQAKKNEDSKKKRKKDGDEHDDDEAKKDTVKSGPSLGAKIFRAFLFTFLATFLTAFLFADPIPNGLRVEFDFLASIKLALIAGVIAAVLRALVGMLPVFDDD